MNKLMHAIVSLISAAAILTVAACGGGGGGASTTPTGTLGVSLTDAPACGYDNVFVTVSKVRVHQSADPAVADSDPGWHDITLATPARLDLLHYTNGVLFSLGSTVLPAGTYQQLRLVLVPNSGNSAPYANSVVPTGGAEVALTTPSAIQSGIKLINQFTVPAGALADVVLDFNACKSIVTAGASGKYLLKPVITVTPMIVSGTIEGWVDPVLAASATPVTVSAQVVSATGVVTSVKSTLADATGYFKLSPVLDSTREPSAYNLVVSADGHANAVVSGVSVGAGATVDLNSSTRPVALATSAMGTASGVVTVAGATTIDASVQAVQTVATGLSVEAGTTGADSVTGAYLLNLPIAAAKYASYVAAATPLVFATSVNPGKYSLTATSAGASPLSAIIDISTANATQNFAF